MARLNGPRELQMSKRKLRKLAKRAKHFVPIQPLIVRAMRGAVDYYVLRSKTLVARAWPQYAKNPNTPAQQLHRQTFASANAWVTQQGDQYNFLFANQRPPHGLSTNDMKRKLSFRCWLHEPLPLLPSVAELRSVHGHDPYGGPAGDYVTFHLIYTPIEPTPDKFGKLHLALFLPPTTDPPTPLFPGLSPPLPWYKKLVCTRPNGDPVYAWWLYPPTLLVPLTTIVPDTQNLPHYIDCPNTAELPAIGVGVIGGEGEFQLALPALYVQPTPEGPILD